MNRATAIILTLITALAILAGVTSSSPATAATTCTGYSPAVVDVALTPKNVEFTACGKDWNLLQEQGIWDARSGTKATRTSEFGTWLINSQTGISSVDVSHREVGTFQLRRATRITGSAGTGRLLVADWDTEKWVGLSGVTVRLYLGTEAVETRVTDKNGRFDIPSRIGSVRYLGGERYAPSTANIAHTN